MEMPKLRGRVIIGLLLIILGVLFVLHNYNFIYLPDYYFSWEYFFILIGVLFFFLSCNKTTGVIFIAIGLFNLVPELWPLLLVLIGVYIISGRKQFRYFRTKLTTGDQTKQSTASNDYVESINIFGGGTKVVHSDNFKGGNIISVFGGSEINLTNCKLAEGENYIEIIAVFGGATLIIPTDWKIAMDVLPIFGGFGDKRSKDPNKAFQEGRVLVIKGLVLFGGGEIKTIF